MNYCRYFQAHVVKEKTWFFVATLRSYEHYGFDRTLNKEEGLFEFFVPVGYEQPFRELMAWYSDNGIITEFRSLENRLLHNEL